jgi:hypothetical protein
MKGEDKKFCNKHHIYEPCGDCTIAALTQKVKELEGQLADANERNRSSSGLLHQKDMTVTRLTKERDKLSERLKSQLKGIEEIALYNKNQLTEKDAEIKELKYTVGQLSPIVAKDVKEIWKLNAEIKRLTKERDEAKDSLFSKCPVCKANWKASGVCIECLMKSQKLDIKEKNAEIKELKERDNTSLDEAWVDGHKKALAALTEKMEDEIRCRKDALKCEEDEEESTKLSAQIYALDRVLKAIDELKERVG